MGEVDDALVEVGRGDGPGRAVRVVDDQELRPLLDVGREPLQVREEAVLLLQRQPHHLAAEVRRPRPGDGITRHGHERDVAGVDEARRQHRIRGLAADAVTHLGHRVELHAELPLHELRGGVLVVLDAVVRVAAVLDLVRLARQRRRGPTRRPCRRSRRCRSPAASARGARRGPCAWPA